MLQAEPFKIRHLTVFIRFVFKGCVLINDRLLRVEFLLGFSYAGLDVGPTFRIIRFLQILLERGVIPLCVRKFVLVGHE
jgi:hypothetical protein